MFECALPVPGLSAVTRPSVRWKEFHVENRPQVRFTHISDSDRVRVPETLRGPSVRSRTTDAYSQDTRNMEGC